MSTSTRPSSSEMVTSWMLSEKDYDLAAQSEQVADLILTGLL